MINVSFPRAYTACSDSRLDSLSPSIAIQTTSFPVLTRDLFCMYTEILVVPYHAPAMKKSSAPQHTQNAWTCAFATDLLSEGAREEDRVLLQQVDHWGFGHTHYTTA